MTSDSVFTRWLRLQIANAHTSGLVIAIMVLLVVSVGKNQAAEPDKSAGANRLDPVVEEKITALLAQMTLEEKVAFCSGIDKKGGGKPTGPGFSGVPRLHIPPLYCSDGPRGAKTSGVAFPAGPGQSASWDTALAQQLGAGIGRSAKANNKAVLLGPAFNILRDPIGGRWFEYYSEDPVHNGLMASAIASGIQSEGVAACLKHFACNNREENRNNYMSMVDERTLREIYLPAYKMGVEAGTWTMMIGANGLNGEPLSDSRHLLHDILKVEWGFNGFIMTDWNETKSLDKAIAAGLDVSMAGPGRASPFFGKDLLQAVKAGKISVSEVDDRVRRVLRVTAWTGKLDHTWDDHFEVDEAAARLLARRVAEEGMVLLKNVNHALPFNLNAMHRILVIGPNAEQKFCRLGEGGSSCVPTENEVTALAGIRNSVGTKATVETVSMEELLQGNFQPIPGALLEDGGFRAFYFKGAINKRAKNDDAILQTKVDQVDFMWEMRSPDVVKLGVDNFSARFSGTFIPPVSGTYAFRVVADDSAVMLVNKGEILTTTKIGEAAVGRVELVKGVPAKLEIIYSERQGDASIRLDYAPPMDGSVFAAAMKGLAEKAAAADAVVFVGGLNHAEESEGRDRTHIRFPEIQTRLINAVARINPRTVVVLYEGAPLEIGPWIKSPAAVLAAWYPGAEGGNAIGRLLCGTVNPSGKLPFTWPNSLAETPAHAVGTQDADRIDFKEGIYVGYRYYDKEKIRPQFAFGHGLSYTTFAYEKMEVKPAGSPDRPMTATVTLKNTGQLAGKEVVQVYVSTVGSRVEQVAKELAGFAKVELKPGESRTVEIPLNRLAFEYYDVAAKKWVRDAKFIIHAGGTSDALPLQAEARLPEK